MQTAVVGYISVAILILFTEILSLVQCLIRLRKIVLFPKKECYMIIKV